MILGKRANEWFDLLQLPDFNWWQFLVAALCMVVLIWSIVRLISRVHEDVDPAETDHDMLNTISELRREGDLTEDEYRSIKSQLMSRLSSNFPDKSKSVQPKPKVQTFIDSNLSSNTVFTTDQAESSSAAESESNQLTSSSRLTELPDSLDDPANNAPGLVAPQTENGEESNDNIDRIGK